jgi:hypothetical protein
MKKLPVGIQTFSKLIKGNYLYVDKTEEIYKLLSGGGQSYFLSRPRRFGKSLLISTLKEIFSGNKELFKGLWIYDKWEWEEYPVIHLDFLGLEYEGREQLVKTLEFLLNQNAAVHGIQLTEDGYDKRFRELILKLSRENPVVILVDEYDKPLIDYVENDEIETARENRKVLKTFYGAIKGADEYLKFVFITGVSKFSKVSIFSGLNNPDDISVGNRFSTLLGYTHQELLYYFKDRLGELPVETIKKWYNGYSWDGRNFVYNPLSILYLFTTGEFDNYWFSTGTPTFLTKLIRAKKRNILEFDNLPASSFAFDSYDIEDMEIIPLLFQTGYLTIKEIIIKKEKKKYRLGYPNKEVRDSFMTYLFREYTQQDLTLNTRLLERMSEAIEENDMDRLMEEMKSLFASIPYHIFIGEKEAYYHSIIYLILRLCGAHIAAEDPTNIGRLDAVLETETKIHILEFKIGSEQEALEQIKQKRYHEKYTGSGKDIVLIGIGFDPQNRNIGNYLVEALN